MCCAVTIIPNTGTNRQLIIHRIGATNMNENRIGSSIPVRNATNAVDPKKIPTSFLFSLGAAIVKAAAIPTYPPMYSGKNPAWNTPDPMILFAKALISPKTISWLAITIEKSPAACASSIVCRDGP